MEIGSKWSVPLVVYRGAKYNGGLNSKLKVHVKHSFINFVSGSHDWNRVWDKVKRFLQDLFGFIVFLCVIFPLALTSGVGLYLFNLILIHLHNLWCTKRNLRRVSNERKVAEGAVTVIVRIKGKIVVSELRRRIKCDITLAGPEFAHPWFTDFWGQECVSKDEQEHPFMVTNHVKQFVPRTRVLCGSEKSIGMMEIFPDFYHRGKSRTQKCVSLWLSESFQKDFKDCPPWNILLVDASYNQKERTLVVFRGHSLLLKDARIHESSPDALRFFVQSSLVRNAVREKDLFTTVNSLLTHLTDYFCLFLNSLESLKDFLNGWLELQIKRIHYHNHRMAIIKCLISSLNNQGVVLLNKFLEHGMYVTKEAKRHFTFWLKETLVVVRACSSIPFKVLECFNQENNFELKLINELPPAETQVSWSPSVSPAVIHAIRDKIGTRVESIFLAACSGALSDYFTHTNLKNPGKFDIALKHRESVGYQVISLETKFLNRDAESLLKEVKRIDHQISEDCRIERLANHFIIRLVFLTLPGPLARYFARVIYSKYPLWFSSFVSETKSHLTLPETGLLWDCIVEDCTVWEPSSKYQKCSLCLVEGLNCLRLSAYSQVKAVDTFLTQRLIEKIYMIAKVTGVDQGLLSSPVSSSSASSHCSSPSLSQSCYLSD